MNIIKKIKYTAGLLSNISDRLQKVQEAVGRVEARQNSGLFNANFMQNEFQVYSQWGEDGLIQYLISHIQISRKIFVEFGVESYIESNTRFLLINNCWSGLIIDGSSDNINYVKNDDFYWRHNLKAECAFVTRDNINDLFSRNGIQGDIGLLSVDIDGNDYWVWEAIDSISPAIVVTEYNARFGPEAAVTVPYDPAFVRSKAHFSMIYYGASLSALYMLARRKGYAFVGCNSAGNNAFFVRRDLMRSPLVEMTPTEGFVRNQFRESRDSTGALTYLSREQELALLESLPLINVGAEADI